MLKKHTENFLEKVEAICKKNYLIALFAVEN